jgi:hypothetical protein
MEQKARYPFFFTYRQSKEYPPIHMDRRKELRAERNRARQEAAKWCIDTFGRSRAGNHPMEWRWTEKDGVISFRYEQDACLFRIRWC